jgi:hypothetical protein
MIAKSLVIPLPVTIAICPFDGGHIYRCLNGADIDARHPRDVGYWYLADARVLPIMSAIGVTSDLEPAGGDVSGEQVRSGAYSAASLA